MGVKKEVPQSNPSNELALTKKISQLELENAELNSKLQKQSGSNDYPGAGTTLNDDRNWMSSFGGGQ